MALQEDEVYVSAKAFLAGRGWTIVAGQPPAGSDHLPVVEIKIPGERPKGSGGAYKPDLVARRGCVFILVECKPLHSEADASKLRLVLGNDERTALLHEELRQRGLLSKGGPAPTLTEFREHLIGALAHSGLLSPQRDLFVIGLGDGDGRVVRPELGGFDL